MNALELQGLTKHYKDFTLGPLDLTLPGGTICGLIGENGAGKSTTIRLILDMVQRDGGTVTILGRDSRTASVRAKEEIGVVLGSEGIPLCLNAVQAGKVMAGIYRNWDAAAYAELCQKFGLLASFMGYFVSSGDSAFESILPAHGSALVGVVVLAAVLALYAASWRLSVAWYGKAEQ